MTPPSADPLGIVVVEGQPIMRVGLLSVLRGDASLDVLAMCSTGAEGIARCGELRPSLAILDLVLPDLNGIEACRSIKRRSPETSVLVFTSFDDNASVFGAVGAGASGYVLKDISPENLLRAIHAVYRGETMLHPRIARHMLDQVSQLACAEGNGHHHTKALSPRETEILVEVAKGATNKEIARRLFVSESTVKSRLRVIFEKVEARDRAQAAAYAIRSGYVR